MNSTEITSIYFPHNKIENQPIINIFGDSHSLAFKNIENCKIFHLGPVTMYKIGKTKGSKINYLIRKFNIDDNNICIFVFGEIDVRCHILKQSFLRKLNTKIIIDELIKNYLDAILRIKILFNNLKIIVYSIVPPSNMCPNNEFPIYGSIEDRITITKILNKNLEFECKKNNLFFLNCYEYFNKDGILNKGYSDGCIHIDEKYNEPIKKELFKLLNLPI